MQGRTRRWQLLIGVVLLVALPLSVPGTSFAGTQGAFLSEGVSTHWAGAAIEGSGASGIIAGFVVPTVTCSRSASQVSIWAGIDGAVRADTHELVQAGVGRDCNTGTPGVWYGFWQVSPTVGAAKIPQTTFTASSGDQIYVVVQDLGGGSVTFTLYDQTEQRQDNFTETYPGTLPDLSAECIVEAPIPPGKRTAGHLSQFTPITFNECVGDRLTSHGDTVTCNVFVPTLCVSGSAIEILSTARGAFERAATTDPINTPYFTVSWVHQ